MSRTLVFWWDPLQNSVSACAPGVPPGSLTDAATARTSSLHTLQTTSAQGRPTQCFSSLVSKFFNIALSLYHLIKSPIIKFRRRSWKKLLWKAKIKRYEDLFHKPSLAIKVYQLFLTTAEFCEEICYKWLLAACRSLSHSDMHTARQLLSQCQHNISMIFQVSLKQQGYWPDCCLAYLK